MALASSQLPSVSSLLFLPRLLIAPQAVFTTSHVGQVDILLDLPMNETALQGDGTQFSMLTRYPNRHLMAVQYLEGSAHGRYFAPEAFDFSFIL